MAYRRTREEGYYVPMSQVQRIARRKYASQHREVNVRIRDTARDDLDYLMREWAFPTRVECVRVALLELARRTKNDELEVLDAPV